MRRWLAVVVVVLAAAACQPVCSRSPNAAESGWRLTFTGPQAGSVSSGSSDCIAYTGSKRFYYALSSHMNGPELIITLTIHSGFTGKGSYKVGTTLDGAGEVRLDVGGYLGSSSTGAGTITVGSDGKSGALDANLPQGEHVSGTWSCDKYEGFTT